jgi:hypothetical protein
MRVRPRWRSRTFYNLFYESRIHRGSVVDRHRFDANPDPDPNFHVDADPDPEPDQHDADHADPTPSFTHVGKSRF